MTQQPASLAKTVAQLNCAGPQCCFVHTLEWVDAGEMAQTVDQCEAEWVLAHKWDQLVGGDTAWSCGRLPPVRCRCAVCQDRRGSHRSQRAERWDEQFEVEHQCGTVRRVAQQTARRAEYRRTWDVLTSESVGALGEL